jgi:hypothetical protein
MDSTLTGVCDLCGGNSDGSIQECNLLSCTFAHCQAILYHQVGPAGPGGEGWPGIAPTLCLAR